VAELDWQRVKDVFQAALDAPPEGRAGLLDRLCSGDAALRREVDSLLAAEASAGEFLAGPASGESEPAPTLAEGRRVGPYRIVGEIARGGMGTVLRAVRDDDTFRRGVALKVVAGGYASELIAQRFRRERQILGRLQHPNIATVLDGGRTDDGLLYLVMEEVEGVPITRYCAEHGLGVRARVEMLRSVCAAVHYAHQNLVVHRDLKPDNILVTVTGVPKLLDFGIAKLLAAGVDPDEAPTATLVPMMTPTYASPEQLRGGAITTASDIYSLGVLAYELLSGGRPYTVRTDSLHEMLRVVCETEHRPPSAMAPATLAGALRGDLDTIVMKALRKEPERRYLSALELSDDLERYLEGRPVRARPDSIAYRARKFVTRHRVGVAAAAFAALSLLAGVGATLHQARLAAESEARARRHLADVRRLANAFLFEFHDAIRTLPGATPARELVVKRAVEYLDSLSREAADPTLQRELAAAYERLGDVQGAPGGDSLGDAQGAIRSYEKSLALRRELGERAEAGAADAAALAGAEMKLGRALISVADLVRAEELARRSAARFEAAEKAAGDLYPGGATALHTLGYVQARRGDAAAALATLSRAVAAGEAFGARHPEDLHARVSLAFIRNELARSLHDAGQHEEALRVCATARADLEGPTRRRPDARVLYAGLYILGVEADAREALGDRAAAHAARRSAVELARELAAADPRSQGSRLGLTLTLHFLGAGLVRDGRLEEGVARLREARRAGESALAADPGSSFARLRLGELRAELGHALVEREAAEACAELRSALRLFTELERAGRLPADSRGEIERVRRDLEGCGPGEAG
jgi:non-specific serine/threonine protein kinase/serine/threonine-protein kinase